MLVTTAKIKELNPCESRLNAFLVKHSKFKGTMLQFLNLKDVPYSDKTWVYFRLLPKDKLPLVAADIAESVLSLYEEKYPNDSRPREAIKAARTGKNAADAYAYAATDAAANALCLCCLCCC